MIFVVLEITKENFGSEVLNSKGPVLVDFWAPWCGPCRMLGPIVEEVGKEMEGKLKVAKCNVDDNQEIAGRFAIMSIPTLILFKDGHAVDTRVGAMPKERLKAWIKEKTGKTI
ncbi:Thioredoxin [Candidatus Gugararchaeum adminiculabundum]|nr:Thioredoxin [Candidatus Gugararchaeum adminiculabundum]